MEGSADVSLNEAHSDVGDPEAGESELPGKEENAVAVLSVSQEPCAAGLSKGGLLEAPGLPAAPPPPTDPTGGVALKMATTLLHPVCLGENPLMLPIHLQMAAAPGPQLGQMGAAPYLLTGANPVSLPLVLDQQVIQHVSPAVIPQNNILCQNPLSFSLPVALDQKSTGPQQEPNLLSLLQNPAFAAILQDLFPSQTPPSTCHSPSSPFFPLPPLTAPYSSPLAPLVPPATLLVPYPVIIPLPVPLPVPLPIPVPQSSVDSKTNLPKAICTESKSTQTPRDFNPPPSSSRTPHSMSPQVLDLSMRACPIEPKQEYLSPQQQDSVLDLSVPAGRKQCVRSRAPVSLDSKLLGGLASLEFSRQHKWMMDSGAGGSTSLGPGAGNLEIVSASQTAKVIVSVKDAIPAILCGKIKSLSSSSTKNFSIKRDQKGAPLQQLYGVPPAPEGEAPDTGEHLKKTSKNRAIKLKKVSSQEIHFLPIKKQRLAALFPRK
ncbi:retinoic acid-induced protein 2 [Dunckerocampus dactyliophorus]|uniref:retinoic acid-induced protein 2 n=1 Tax=Dunckerocampus dactyliophorus TaxID=161453 RepID=UPI002406B74B|nr:retinoic acid-induced protein 2 [Dunckerocampus dactyliophorus]